MSLFRTLQIVLFISLLFLSGCAKSRQVEEIEQVCLPDIDRQQAMKAAEDVLTGMHFKISKADSDAGIIRTEPLTGAQFFEFWRKDNVGSFNTSESNLHTIRRIVQVDINSQADEVCIGCNVKTQKLSLSERQDYGSSRAYSLFSKRSSNLQRLRLDDRAKAWVDVGSDTRLSSTILEKIRNELKGRQGKKVQ